MQLFEPSLLAIDAHLCAANVPRLGVFIIIIAAIILVSIDVSFVQYCYNILFSFSASQGRAKHTLKQSLSLQKIIPSM